MLHWLVFKKNKNILRYFLVFSFLISSLLLAYTVNAQVDLGLETINDNISLSANDPRVIATRIINIAMLVLGLIAVGLVIGGGFIWMTSNGQEDKIETAKKILKNGVIGLIIILSAWGIATFVLSRLISATGGGNTGGPCLTGDVIPCACGGQIFCTDGSWGACLNGDCGGSGGPTYCDSSPLPQCQPLDQICSSDQYCEATSCQCIPRGNLGDACNADPENQTCIADDNLCAEYLSCSVDTCTCFGPPIITNISPMGGFCENDINQSCLSDDDCATTCNLSVPNGARDNLITISGANFGEYDPLNSRVLFNSDVLGVEPSNLNPSCIDSWTNNQIIIAVPEAAIDGPLTVVTTDDQRDVSNDQNGPVLPDFIINNIVRPGLCLMSPDSGSLSDQVNYQGFNLYSAEAYFGNYQNNVRGLDSVFVNPMGLEGMATVPNVQQGKMTSFVTANINGNQERSNYVDFSKAAEPNSGPFISYFEPASGRAGQYVTIYGGGFGSAKGFSQVYFGDVEADYNFPPICASSIWQDKQIVVKVPASLTDGAHQISIRLNGVEINSQNTNPNVFIADSSESLKTSICRISPSRGQIGTQVNIWGEYFGDSGGSALAVFTSNRSVNSNITSDQGAQKLEPNVPLNSASGPLRVVKNGEWGNAVNFEVGVCNNDSECGADICCPVGTYRENQCVVSSAECYVNIPNSVFEWGFITGFGGIGTTTTTTFDSCQGMASFLGACQVGAFCPNSAGLCSPYQGGVTNLGACDSTCNSFAVCNNPQSCTYNSAQDVCVVNNSVCSLNSILNYQLNGDTFSAPQTCKTFSQFNNQSHWEITVPTSCPDSWTRLSGNRCVDSTSTTNSTCSLCASGLNCMASLVGPLNQGVCATTKLCSQNASCNGTVCSSNESARCDCCCEIGQDARDCCAPLVCDGTCGSDTSDDGTGLGQCSGCAIPAATGGFNTALSDQACNCAISSGKYCDTSVPSGVCNDCSRLSRESCLEHSQSCCLDSRGTDSINDDICVGGNGQTLSNDPGNLDFGYCAYYNCQDESGDPSLCAADDPQRIGLFRDISVCEDNCESNPGISFCSQHNGDYASCSAASGCCYNFSDSQCIGGQSINEINGYCAYYNCQAAPNEDQCNLTPSMTGEYNTTASCISACGETPIGGAGQDCRNLSTQSDCNNAFCSSPFACLNEAGAAGLPGDCGTCCCQVGNPSSCSGIGSGDLVCQPNQAPCSGENRGLCCGCSQDLDCGDAVNLGCDSGTCCRARPHVLTDQVVPAHGSDGICRNAGILIPFDEFMDVPSLMNNIILFEERDYGNGVCPAGTFVASVSTGEKSVGTWFNNTIKRVYRLVLSIFKINDLSQSALAHPLPDGSKLYCSVPGSISVRQLGDGSVAEFRPKKILAADTTYYLVVKGDETLNSDSGVMSQWQVGMNGQGYLDLNNNNYVEGENITFNNLSFHNSYISSFATLPDQGASSGVCTISYTQVSPSSYLFQRNDNDINENDTDINSSSFDTIRDRDKLFTASAYSSGDQLLVPNSGYYWDWDWEIMNSDIASLSDLPGLASQQAFVSAAEGLVDASTVMNTTINMNRFIGGSCNTSNACVCVEPGCLNNCCNFYEDGNGIEMNTPLFVFICKNPWPAINTGFLTWSPWYDTCDGATGNCANYNYEFYYCRDNGSDGLSDDLPAIINPGLILGATESLVCSEGQLPCSGLGSSCGPDNNGDGSGDGFCVWNVLKESYFFKEAKPTVGAITSAVDQLDGSSVRVAWYGDSSLIYNTNPAQVGKYRIYYAPENVGTWSFIDVKPNSLVTTDASTLVCAPSNPNPGQNYSCQKVINGLNTNVNYRFKVSAISVNKVESALSDEKTVLVTDSIAPIRPQNLSVLAVNGQRLRFNWLANTDDALFYRLYHGVSADQYGQSFDSENNVNTLELDSRQFSSGANYFALSAIDSSGNESLKSSPVYIMLNVQ